MGLLSSLKKNFQHGGVKIQLQAPQEVSQQDAVLPVAITISATDSPAQINSVTAKITAMSFNKSFSVAIGKNESMNQPMSTLQIVAQTVNPQGFNLSPGQSQSINLQLSMNPAGNAAGEFMQKLESASQLFNPNMYVYTLVASADVEGVALDPSASQKLKIKGAGSVSNIGLKL